MLRLLLVLLLLLILVLVALIVFGLARMVLGPTDPPPASEGKMPKAVQKIAYIALLILMFGITAGWIGGA